MRVWAPSKSVLSGVLGRKLHSTFVQLHNLEKRLPEADNYFQLQAREFFNGIWNFQNFQKITQVARTNTGNVRSGSKLATRPHVYPG